MLLLASLSNLLLFYFLKERLDLHRDLWFLHTSPFLIILNIYLHFLVFEVDIAVQIQFLKTRTLSLLTNFVKQKFGIILLKLRALSTLSAFLHLYLIFYLNHLAFQILWLSLVHSELSFTLHWIYALVLALYHSHKINCFTKSIIKSFYKAVSHL